MSGSSLEIYKWLIAAWFFPGEGDIFPEVLLEAGSTQGCQMKNMFTNKIFLSQQKTKTQSFSRRFFAWKYSYSWTITRVSVTLLYNSCDTTHFDSEDDYRTGCRNVSHCQQQQSYSGLCSPAWSISTYFWIYLVFVRTWYWFSLCSECFFFHLSVLMPHSQKVLGD